MRKTNLMKILSMVLIVTILISIATSVLAATDNDVFDQLYLNNSTGNGTSLDLTNNNTTGNNTNSNNTSNNTNVNRNNSSSNYNSNSSLPKTGIEDSIPVALLVVIFGISAIYAYKKISEYKNV